MNDYRGLHFDSGEELKFYEGGAHFKYNDLCKQLDILLKFLPKSRHGIQSSLDKKEEHHRNYNQSRNNGKELVQYLTQKMSEFNKERYDYIGKGIDMNTRNSHSKGKLNQNYSQDIILMKDQSPMFDYNDNDNDNDEEEYGMRFKEGEMKMQRHHHTRNKMGNDMMNKGRNHNTQNENYQPLQQQKNSQHGLYQSHSQTQGYIEGSMKNKSMINCPYNNSNSNNNHFFYNNNISHTKSISNSKKNNDITTSSLYLSQHNNQSNTIKTQNKKSLYHLIKQQKKTNKSNDKDKSNINPTNANEISSLSDLNSSMQEDSKIQGNNSIIVKPKINISFVNNINALGIPIESRSRNTQNIPHMKTDQTVKQNRLDFDNETLCKYLKQAANSKLSSNKSHSNHLNPHATVNVNLNTKNNYHSKMPNPFFLLKQPKPKINMESRHNTNMINPHKITMSSLSKDKDKDRPSYASYTNELTPNTQSVLQQQNISEKYSLLQRKINQMKVKTRNDLAKLSVDFENLIAQTRKKSVSKGKSQSQNNHSQDKEKGKDKEHVNNQNNFITANNIKSIGVNHTMTSMMMMNIPAMNTFKKNASQLSTKAYMDKNFNSNPNGHLSNCNIIKEKKHSNSRNKYK